MKTTMKLTKKQAKPIVKATFPEYTGRKYSIEFVDMIAFYNTNWDGGTKNEFAFVNSDGKSVNLNVPAPWINPVEGKSVFIPENVLVVEHSYYCGQDMGIRIYANPCHLPKWLHA